MIALAVFVRGHPRLGRLRQPAAGQAVSNALSLNGRDIFAWSDPPTIGATWPPAGRGCWSFG